MLEEASEAMTESRSSSQSNGSSGKDIYYFGYGPICNQIVRKRRGIEVLEVEAAFVPDYRLTFAFGGIANIVKKKGFEVHGVLMKLKSHEDWKKLREHEVGNCHTMRTVIPYSVVAKQQELSGGSCSEDDDYHNADDDFNATSSMTGAVQAFLIEFPERVDDTLLDAPIERLPQERYLKLVAQGMRQQGVDEDYITDQLEACPFAPMRNPEEYQVFPAAKRLQKISMVKYERLCERGNVEGDVYFCLGNCVFRLGEHDPENPLAKWFEAHGHGKPDCTFQITQTVIEPSIPEIEDETGVTDLHIAWAENHVVETVAQFGMTATCVYELANVTSLSKKGFSSTDTDKIIALTSFSEEAAQEPTEGRCCSGWLFRLVSGGSRAGNCAGNRAREFDEAVSMRFSTKTALVP